MLNLVCHGEVCDGSCGVPGAVLRCPITAEIQDVIRTFWGCDKPKCARVVAGTAFSSSWSSSLSGNSNCPVWLWGHCRGFTYRCNSCALRGLPALPLPGGRRALARPLLCPREGDQWDTVWIRVWRILNSHISRPSLCNSHPSLQTFDFSLYRFKLPPLLSKNVPLPHPQLHPLGWQQNPPVAITTSSSPAKSARPCHTSLPASKSPSLCEQHSFPPQVFAICLLRGRLLRSRGCRPCATPMCLLPPPCMLCSPLVWSTHKTGTTFTVPRTLWAKTPLLWPIKPMQNKLWIHENGRIARNTVKKMCLGLYPGLVWKLEGVSRKKSEWKKKNYKAKSLGVPALWSEPQVQPTEYLLLLGKASLLLQAGCGVLWAELAVPAESTKTSPSHLELLMALLNPAASRNSWWLFHPGS